MLIVSQKILGFALARSDSSILLVHRQMGILKLDQLHLAKPCSMWISETDSLSQENHSLLFKYDLIWPQVRSFKVMSVGQAAQQSADSGPTPTLLPGAAPFHRLSDWSKFITNRYELYKEWTNISVQSPH